MSVSQKDLSKMLRQLWLSRFADDHVQLADEFEHANKGYINYLEELVLRETQHRHQKRIERLLKQAKVPRTKTLESFDTRHVSGLTPSKLQGLADGEFIDQLQNLLLFGNPGTGKTHLCLALVQEWCLQGRRVYYATAADLIQQLLKAKADLTLPGIIKKLDRFEVLIIDDISYTACDKQETDVLFTLLSARYEMRSIVITSNLTFGQWDQIFKDGMTTQAAIDRLVHHAIILELNGESYRVKAAKERNKKDETEEVTT